MKDAARAPILDTPNSGKTLWHGSLRVTVLLFSAMRLQKWLLGIGALLLVTGFLVGPPGLYVFAVLGLILPLVPLLFAGGAMLRYFVSPRSLRFVPRARVQMIGGMMLSVALIATVAVLVAWAAGYPPDRVGTLWLRVALSASLLLICQFLLVTSVPGMTLWFLVLGGTGFAVARSGPLWDLSTAIGSREWLMTAILGSAWLAFSAWFLRVRSFKPMTEVTTHGTRVAKVDVSAAAAIRAFLFGNPSLRYQFFGGFAGVLLICGVWTLLAVAVRGAHSFSDIIGHQAGVAFMLGTYAGVGGFMVAARSKSLWLRGGLDRKSLFHLCERQAWQFFSATGGSLAVLLAIVWLSNPERGPANLIALLFQMSMGACLLYIGLMHVSGWRVFDVVCMIALTLFWIVTLPLLANVMERLWLLPELVGGLAAFAFILRLVAVNRWEHIDWLVCRPPKLTPRGLPSAS